MIDNGRLLLVPSDGRFWAVDPLLLTANYRPASVRAQLRQPGHLQLYVEQFPSSSPLRVAPLLALLLRASRRRPRGPRRRPERPVRRRGRTPARGDRRRRAGDPVASLRLVRQPVATALVEHGGRVEKQSPKNGSRNASVSDDRLKNTSLQQLSHHLACHDNPVEAQRS